MTPNGVATGILLVVAVTLTAWAFQTGYVFAALVAGWLARSAFVPTKGLRWQ